MDQENLCYKDFIYCMRKHAYKSEPFIILNRVAPKLSQIVRLLSEVKFARDSYHTYYGDVKRIMGGFLSYYYVAMDDIAKNAVRLCKSATREDIMELMEKTVEINIANHDDFRKDYIPANLAEQNKFEEIEKLYGEFMKKVLKLLVFVGKLRKPEAQKFAKTYFEMSFQVPREFCEITFTYLSLMLAEDMDKTRVSLLEIHNRLKNNLRTVNEEAEEEKIALREQLYQNNEKQMARRVEYNISALDIAEAEAATQTVNTKSVQNIETKEPLTPLEEEVDYWSKKFEDYNKVAENLILIKKEVVKVDLQEKTHSEMKCTECSKAWYETVAKTFSKQKAYLKEQWEKAARALLTFYACRGLDQIYYKDNIGKYYMDDYEHQVYPVDYGLAEYHLTCENQFVTFPEEKYYFDKHGRYVYKDERKLHQLAPCCSLYQLGADEVLHKYRDSKELGVSEAYIYDKQHRRKMKDPNYFTVLPDIDPFDIKRTLDKDSSKYLWDTFGSILPYALYDVAISKSKNPIHYLAHRLLYLKYNVSQKELRDKKIEAEAFKANIYKERHEKLLSASKAWKSQQVKRRQPEESDDAQERAVYDAEKAQRELINTLNAL